MSELLPTSPEGPYTFRLERREPLVPWMTRADPRLVRFAWMDPREVVRSRHDELELLSARGRAADALRLPAGDLVPADLATCGPAAALSAGIELDPSGLPVYRLLVHRVVPVEADPDPSPIASDDPEDLWAGPGGLTPMLRAQLRSVGPALEPEQSFRVEAVPHADLASVLAQDGVHAVELGASVLTRAPTSLGGLPGRLVASKSRGVTVTPPAGPGLQSPSALVGIVDMSFDVGHPDLAWRVGWQDGWPVYLDGPTGRRSKIRAMWDLSRERVWPGSLIDEDLSNRTQRALTPSFSYSNKAQALGKALSPPGVVQDHGTMSAFMAAGRPHTHRATRRSAGSTTWGPSAWRRGSAPDAELLLAALASEGQGGEASVLATTDQVISAVAWMDKVAGSRPLVVNLSLGTPFGPRDGSSLVTQMLDGLSGPGRVIVVAAGNDNEAGRHVRVRSEPGGSANLGWTVGNTADLNDGAVRGVKALMADGLQVWTRNALPGGTGAPVHAMLRIPDGQGGFSYLEVAPDDHAVLRISNPRGDVCDVYVDNRRAWPSNGCGRIEVWWQPLNGAALPPGDWSLHLHPVYGGQEFLADAWLGVNDAANIRWSRPLATKDQGTLSDLACGAETIAVGNAAISSVPPPWEASPHVGPAWLHRSSSCGPTADGRPKPDLVAEGTAMTVPCAIDRSSATRFPVEMVRFASGTSVSAPRIAGACAILLGQAPHLTPRGVLQSLRASSTPVTGEARTGWGWGFFEP